MTAVALALSASLLYGGSDFLAGRATRRVAPGLVALWSQVAGGTLLLAAVLGARQAPDLGALGGGALVGVVGALGVLAFYQALRCGPTSVVSPVAASGILIPVAFGLASGMALSPAVAVGLPLTLAGLVVISRTDDDPVVDPSCPGRRPRLPRPLVGVPRPSRAAALALVAGASFGTAFVLLDLATRSAPSQLWTIAGFQAGALPVTLASLLFVQRVASWRVGSPGLLVAVLAVGVLDLVADGALTVAADAGDIATVSVLASLDPVVAIGLATAVGMERLSRTQALGIAACLAGVVLLSLPG